MMLHKIYIFDKEEIRCTNRKFSSKSIINSINLHYGYIVNKYGSTGCVKNNKNHACRRFLHRRYGWRRDGFLPYGIVQTVDTSRAQYWLVGSQRSGPSSLPDKDHEGHSGWTIPQIASNINNWLNTHNPDVVFLWIGGNDLLLNGNLNATGLSNLIDQISRWNPM